MSISLVKKSLNLLATETPCVNESSNSRTSCQSKKHKKKRLVDGKKHAALLVQKIREKSKTEKQTNKVDVNVQRLLNLSQANIIHRKLENKLLDTVTKKNKSECDASKEQKSAFTEEDFAKFENEYFVN